MSVRGLISMQVLDRQSEEKRMPVDQKTAKAGRQVTRRLDHVAIVVKNTDQALRYFVDTLQLSVAASEEVTSRGVRLTYLDAGNIFIQLVEPVDPTIEISKWLAENGEGLHHICFAVDNVEADAPLLAEPGAPPVRLSGGRGRVTAWIPGTNPLGLRVELTEFHHREDVEEMRGWLA
jgi:methylmalonyl-CoA/ethylmalonyl-CoA epimerase